MEWKKEKSIGLIATVLFHVLLVLLFMLLAFRTPLPLPGEEGVEVNLGYSNQGMGNTPQKKRPTTAPKKVEQQKTTPKPPPTPVSNTDQVKENKLLTQNTEEAPAIPEKKKDETKQKENKPKPEQTKDTTQVKIKEPIKDQLADNKKVEEEVKEEAPKVNPRALYRGPSSKGDGGGNEGVTNQPGNQGKPNGILDAKKYEGAGGLGNGIGFDLGGRGAKTIPKPEYNSKEQGRVVVTIHVDQQGNVIKAIPGARGTNITDQNLRKMAEQAALKAKFSEDPNAPSIQKGTITYNFIRKN